MEAYSRTVWTKAKQHGLTHELACEMVRSRDEMLSGIANERSLAATAAATKDRDRRNEMWMPEYVKDDSDSRDSRSRDQLMDEIKAGVELVDMPDFDGAAIMSTALAIEGQIRALTTELEILRDGVKVACSYAAALAVVRKHRDD